MPADGHHRQDIDTVVELERDSASDACQHVHATSSTAQTDLLSGFPIDAEMVDRVDVEMTSSEDSFQLISARRSSVDVPIHQRQANGSSALSDENAAEYSDWRVFSTSRVDVAMLLDALLARQHRDRAAREFLRSLPAPVSKKYDVFRRQHPIFVCLNIFR